MFPGRTLPAIVSRVLACALAVMPCGCKKSGHALQAGSLPASKKRDHWPDTTLEAAGLDAAKLDLFAAAVHGNGVIIRHGAVAYKWGQPHKPLDIASASKAIYSFLVLKAVEKRMIPSLDQPVVEWMPELGTLNPALEHKDRLITWRHLINQTSCYGVTEKPGTAFDYNDYQTGLLWTLIFEKLYKTPGADAIRTLRTELFDLIETEDKPALRAMQSNGRLHRLTISPLDMARFGSVFLRDGKWKGREIIGHDSVDLVLHHPLPLELPRTLGKPAEMLPDAPSYGGGSNQDDHLGSYSQMWWLNQRDKSGALLFPSAPEDAFAAIGYGGEKVLMVVPSLDLIISWNTEHFTRAPMVSTGRRQMNEVLQLAFAAVKK